MNPAVLLFGFLAGLDNLYACGAAGMLPLQRGRRHLFALSSCVCELAAPFLGLALGRIFLATIEIVTDHGAPLLMLFSGAAMLLSCLRRRDTSDLIEDGGLLFGLPLSLSLDNVAAGATVSALDGPKWLSALSVGAISAMMSCAGIYFGGWIGRLLPSRTRWLAAGYLCVLAARMWLRE
ncbi:MAG: manganese efflux pump [Candidatus Sulfotelmatobacter sp.]